MSEPVAATAVHLAIAADAADRAQYVPGQVVTAQVVSRSSNNQAVIDVGGRILSVELPPEIEAGSTVALRVQSVTVADLDAELQIEKTQATFPGIDAKSVTQNMMRFVDAAATRFFGSAAEQRTVNEMQEPPVRFVTRGDLPRYAPIELDPESLKNSSALATQRRKICLRRRLHLSGLPYRQRR